MPIENGVFEDVGDYCRSVHTKMMTQWTADFRKVVLDHMHEYPPETKLFDVYMDVTRRVSAARGPRALG